MSLLHIDTVTQNIRQPMAKTGLLVNLVALMVVLVPFSDLIAQGKTTKKAPIKPTIVATQQPSLDETRLWLETEAPPLMRAYGSHLDAHTLISTSDIHYVTRVTLDSCVLTVATADTTSVESPNSKHVNAYRTTYSIPLRDLDLAATTVEDHWIESLMDEAEQMIRVKTRVAAGATIATLTQEGIRRLQGVALLFVRNQPDGERVARAIRRGGKLCGAPDSPF
jgi:hypothetical protein